MAYDVPTLEAELEKAKRALSDRWEYLDAINPYVPVDKIEPYQNRVKFCQAALDAAKVEANGTGFQPIGSAFDAILIRIARQNGYEYLLPARLTLQ